MYGTTKVDHQKDDNSDGQQACILYFYAQLQQTSFNIPQGISDCITKVIRSITNSVGQKAYNLYFHVLLCIFYARCQHTRALDPTITMHTHHDEDNLCQEISSQFYARLEETRTLVSRRGFVPIIMMLVTCSLHLKTRTRKQKQNKTQTLVLACICFDS